MTRDVDSGSPLQLLLWATRGGGLEHSKASAQQGQQLSKGSTIMAPTCARQKAKMDAIPGAMQVASPLSTSTLPPSALCLTTLLSTVPSAGPRHLGSW